MTDQESGTDQEHWRPPGWGSEPRTGLMVAGGALLVVLGLVVAAVVGSFGEPVADEVADDVASDVADEVADEVAEGEDTDGFVAEFSGEGDGVTDTFEVDGRWQVRWEHDGDEIRVTLLWEDPNKHNVTFGGRGGGGSAFPSDSGELALQVTTDGSWHLRVFEVEDDS